MNIHQFDLKSDEVYQRYVRGLLVCFYDESFQALVSW
jgi:hypothetical protein